MEITIGTLEGKFILIDGNGLAYRAFYALPPLKTSRGEAVNAVYGFTNMLLKIIEKEDPDYIAVAFDKSKPTIRQEQFEEYKAHRQRMPEDLQEQFPIIEDVVRVLRIPIFHREGYEADDCIASLVNAAENMGLSTRIYSGDLDMLQLISDSTQVVTTRRGISDMVVYDAEMVKKRYGIEPRQLVDYKALAGDSSDHIPGIPGIGEASASKLLNQFADLEAMYEQPAKIPSRWRKQILDHRDQAYMSKNLASLEKHLDLCIDWHEMHVKEPFRDDVKKLFTRLEFKNLLEKMGFKEEETQEIQEIAVHIVGKDEDFHEMIAKLKSAGSFSLFWILDEHKKLAGLAVGVQPGSGYYFPFILPEQLNITSTFGISTYSQEKVIHELKPLIDDANITKYVFKLVEGMKYLKRGEYFTGRNFIDIQIAGFMLDPESPPKTMEDVLARYSDFKPKTLDQIVTTKDGETKKVSTKEIPLQDLTLFIGGRAVRLNSIGPDITDRIEKSGMLQPLKEMEMQLAILISAMEARGIKIDKERMQAESDGLSIWMNEILSDIYIIAGHEFNLNSPKQIGKVLFEELGIPGGKKTETGYKTGTDVLEEIEDAHPIIERILKYREVSKIKNSFADVILEQLGKDCKLHIPFNQNGTVTGRITTSSPNLATLPQPLRASFIPGDEERVLIGLELPQFEMQVLSYLSGDEGLKEIAARCVDFHKAVAAKMFNIAEDQVSEDQRKTAKELGYAILHGLSNQAIAVMLGISRTDASKQVDRYFEVFPGVKSFFSCVAETTFEQGEVKTIFGRRRKFPGITSENKNIRATAEKTAVSYYVQGSAVDIIKKSMVDIYNNILQGHRDIHLLAQVNDEFLFETKKRRAEKYADRILEVFKSILPVNIPLNIKIREGMNWLEMNDIK